MRRPDNREATPSGSGGLRRLDRALLLSLGCFLVHCGGGSTSSTASGGTGGASTSAGGATILGGSTSGGSSANGGAWTSGNGGASDGTGGRPGSTSVGGTIPPSSAGGSAIATGGAGGSATGGAGGSAIATGGAGGSAIATGGAGGSATRGANSAGDTAGAGGAGGAGGKNSSGGITTGGSGGRSSSGAATAGSSGGGATGGTAGHGGTATGGNSSAGGASGGTTGGTFTVTSPGWESNAGCSADAKTSCATLPTAMTRSGAGTSPELTWTGAPEATKSFVVLLQDLTNGTTHWILWNIPATVTHLAANVDQTTATPATPAGSQQCGKGTEPGYYGPGAPCDVYELIVYALGIEKFSPTDATDPEKVRTQLNALGTSILGKAIIRGRTNTGC